MNTTSADLILETVEPGRGGRRALAVVDGRIQAMTDTDVDAFVSRWSHPGTVHETLTGFAFPAFVDTHNHLMLTAANELGVPMRDARSVADVVERVRRRAAETPAGQWVVTAADWHESQLAEQRLPTALELDEASADHPVLVLRGGHNGSANTRALELAGIRPGSDDIPGGMIARGEDGTPTGPVQDEALVAVQRHVPPPSQAALIDGIDAVSARYRAHGLATVRDAAVSPSDWAALTAAHAQGRLHVRTHAMIFSPTSAIAEAGGIEAYLDALEARDLRPGTGDDVLRLWGLKLVLDGGVEAAALAEPYADRPDYSGTLLADPATLTGILIACVRRGWPVGAHAVGERAIQAFLEAVAAVKAAGLHPAPRQLVIEHAALITAPQIAQAAQLEVAVTAQQALRDGLVGPFVGALGAHRVARMFPWRALLEGNVNVSAGTDHPIGPLDPLAGIAAMISRRTRLGELGAEQGIDRATAIGLYTRAGAELLDGPDTGTLAPGSTADIAVWPVDLLTASEAELEGLRPVATFVAGLDVR